MRGRAVQGAGDAFGTAADQGTLYRQRLLPSATALRRPDHHLLPMPRGSMAALKLVPLERSHPGPGEIKARPSLASCETCFMCLEPCCRWRAQAGLLLSMFQQCTGASCYNATIV